MIPVSWPGIGTKITCSICSITIKNGPKVPEFLIKSTTCSGSIIKLKKGAPMNERMRNKLRRKPKIIIIFFGLFLIVGTERLELSCPKALVPKTSVYTNFTTSPIF